MNTTDKLTEVKMPGSLKRLFIKTLDEMHNQQTVEEAKQIWEKLKENVENVFRTSEDDLTRLQQPVSLWFVIVYCNK
jgi:hypothetical protein